MYAADTDSSSSQSKPWFVSEANLPEGFPAAGPVDEVVLKTYPQHRLARVQSISGTDGMFWKLFNHIKRNDIKMTAPVEMSWTPKAAANPDGTLDGDPNAMAFLYGSNQLGSAGADSELFGKVIPLERDFGGDRGQTSVANNEHENYPVTQDDVDKISGTWYISAPGGVETLNFTGLGHVGFYIGSHSLEILDRSKSQEIRLKNYFVDEGNAWWWKITNKD